MREFGGPDLVGGDIVVTFPCLLWYFVDRFGLLRFVVGEEPSDGKIYLVEGTLLPYLRAEQILDQHTFLDDGGRGRGVVRWKGEVNSKYRFSVNPADYTKGVRTSDIMVVHLVVESGIWATDFEDLHGSRVRKISAALDLDGLLLAALLVVTRTLLCGFRDGSILVECAPLRLDDERRRSGRSGRRVMFHLCRPSVPGWLEWRDLEMDRKMV